MKFYLDPRRGKDGKHSIIIRGRDSFGKQYRIFLTSVFEEAKTEKANWNQKAQKVKGNPTLGETLKKIKSVVQTHVMKQQILNPAYNIPDAWTELYIKKPEKEKDTFPQKILAAIPVYKAFYRGKKSHGYLRILDQLKTDLEGWNPDIVFSKLNFLTLESFKSYLLSPDRKLKKIKAKPLSSATIYGRVKFLRELSTLAMRHGVLVDQSIFDYKVKYIHRSGGFALTYQELMKVYHYQSDNKTRMIARDYFLFEAFTGIRNSDCQDLRNGNIYSDYIQYFDQKNNDKAKTVTRHKLNDYIIKKYHKKDKPDNFLLPRIAQGTVNGELKFIARELKLDRLIPFNGELQPIHRHLSTHDGRHSYATLLNRLGIPQDYTKEELGHSQGITFGTYVHRDDRFQMIAGAIKDLSIEVNQETEIRKLQKAV